MRTCPSSCRRVSYCDVICDLHLVTRRMIVIGVGRAVRDEADAQRDQYNPNPASGRNGFMQPELRQQRNDDVAESQVAGRTKCQVGPGEGGQVGSEKHNQKSDPAQAPMDF